MYVTRHLENQILEASGHYPVVMLCGQRQVGKSTMMNHLREPFRRYVTLDDIQARHLAETDPVLFFETYGSPLLIDEFQRVPSILIEIKRIVDQKALSEEENNGMFWLTGSQKFQMMKSVSESLAGRVAIFEMSGLSAAELENRPFELFHPDITTLRNRMKTVVPKTIHDIYESIFRGGMPKICTTSIERERYYSDYLNTYLERDIHDLAQVGKLRDYYQFLVFMASHTAQELKYSEIANAIGISAPTAKSWVSILESSGVIFILQPYFSNLTKRLTKTPKVYFMDTGLAAYLCRWPNADTLENGAMDGAFLETYVITEIVRNYLNAGKHPNLYYYRDMDKKEIDLVFTEGDVLYPIEIKKSKAPVLADKNFSVFNRFSNNVQPGIIMCLCDEMIPYDRNTWCFPIAAI